MVGGIEGYVEKFHAKFQVNRFIRNLRYHVNRVEKSRFEKNAFTYLSKVSGSISHIMMRSTYILLIGVTTTFGWSISYS